MPKISIIVPVYNVEKYLSKCIISILCQTFVEFELIMVDDGASDSCNEICDEYCKIDDRIRVIHKKNGGVSSARNFGIDLAEGEYIAFVDADDLLVDVFLEILLKNKSDIVICSVWYANPNGNAYSKALELENKREYVSNERILEWYEHGIMYSVWGRLFKACIIYENNIYFDTQTTRGEDTIFMFNYIEKCKNVHFLSEVLYYYVQYPQASSSSSKLSKSNILALNYLDLYIDNWLKSRGLVSKKFSDLDYWTKSEQLEYFWRIYNNTNITFVSRYKWYSLFFSLNNFSPYVPEYFPRNGHWFNFLMRRKAALPLSIIQSIRRKL